MDGAIVVERRRQWTPEEKAALMAEMEPEGARFSVVTQRHEGRRGGRSGARAANGTDSARCVNWVTHREIVSA